MVSDLFDDSRWERVERFEFEDITYHRGREVPAVRVAFDRPAVRNAFRPETVDELYTALDDARRRPDVGCVLLTGNGPSPADGGWAFCSGGDQSMRGDSGYEYGDDDATPQEGVGRLHILEVQRLIRFMPKPVVCVVPGWAVGGGHSLHVVCDLTIASDDARFKQTDADVASFDAGFGSAYLARQVGQKRRASTGRQPHRSSPCHVNPFQHSGDDAHGRRKYLLGRARTAYSWPPLPGCAVSAVKLYRSTEALILSYGLL